MEKVNNYRDLKTGDLVFKRSNFNDGNFLDKVRNSLMRVINWITRRGTNSEFDHVELIVVNNYVVSTASSEGGVGVRKINFTRWCKRLGDPYLTVVRPPFSYTSAMRSRLTREIEEDCGRYYNASGAVRNLIDKNRGSLNFTDDRYGYNDKLYCSQAVSKWIRYMTIRFADLKSIRIKQRNSKYVLPNELYSCAIKDGWSVVYKGDAYNLLKNKEDEDK